MIRPAALSDIPRLLDWGARFHAMAAPGPGFNSDAVAALLAQLIEADHGAVLMHDHGTIGGVLTPAYCDPAWLMAVEVFWWAERDGLSLLRAFEGWARDSGAQEVRMTSLAALPRADAVLRRKGYAPIEISYSKVI